jgi:uncharacterized protein (DUF2141 family)
MLWSLAVLAAAFGFGIEASAQEIQAELRILNVEPKGGTVYVAVYESAESYKAQKAYKGFILVPESGTLRLSLSLPKGEYMFSIFQDRNGNGKLDTNFLGIPKELVGISNYDGKGIPGGFDKQKILLDGSRKVVEIRLIDFF